MIKLSTLFLLLTLAAFASAQVNEEKSKGSIVGIITNEHADPIINALVYLKKDAELFKVTTSDTLGMYQFTSLAAETYSIHVSYVGYFKKDINDVVVGDGKTELDFTMKEFQCTHGH